VSQRQRRSYLLIIGAGIIVPLVVAAAAIPVREYIGNTNIALVLMGVVVAVAASGNRTAAIVAAIASAVWFDFFATRPYYSFTLNRHQDWVSIVLLLVAGIIVSEVAIWGRHQQAHAERSLSEVAALRSIAEMAASGEDPTIVQVTAAFWLRELLPAKDCRYERVQDHELSPLIDSDGTVSVGNIRWTPESMGLPGPEVGLPVRNDNTVVGYFMITPRPGEKVSQDRLFTAAAIADQVGAVHSAG
jgi:K+-sensing histidine kinase KdpD